MWEAPCLWGALFIYASHGRLALYEEGGTLRRGRPPSAWSVIRRDVAIACGLRAMPPQGEEERMTEPRPEKVAVVEDLERRLRASQVVILTDYRGLTVDEIGALRGRLREANIEYRVAKNTLLAIAAERCGYKELSQFLSGPTAVVFGQDDPSVPARLLQEFIRQYRKLEIKGGMVSGEALDAAGMRALATLPTRVELLARTVGMIQAPLRMIVAVLSGPARGLVTALDALRVKREADGGGGAAEAGTETAEVALPVEAPPAEGAPAEAPPAEGAPAEAPPTEGTA
jgi:large subunit ribosomal protein L10